VTYCVGIKLDAGLVFASDSRTNAGLDHISTFRKMMVYERPGDRFMMLLSAGNLSLAQSVREILQVTQMPAEEEHAEPLTIWNARSMFDAARLLGVAMRRVAERDAAALKQAGLDFNVSMILGGQIKGEAMRMFLVYSAGNFIEATRETCYFQIGESKYGKPVLDRLLTPEASLEDGTKCALLSMDETMKSNLSVGLPIDLAVYRESALESTDIICVDEHNPYYTLIHNTWGERLRHAFESIEAPVWSEQAAKHPLRTASRRHRPIRKISKYDERIC
jgi:putative proteasome-type protease